ncbi:hypothetical protein BgiBS90_002306, partial [Biomphalaria glabrata]
MSTLTSLGLNLGRPPRLVTEWNAAEAPLSQYETPLSWVDLHFVKAIYVSEPRLRLYQLYLRLLLIPCPYFGFSL